MKKKELEKILLDLGCGNKKREGYTGVDICQQPGVDIVHDLRKKWPWKDNSVEDVVSSHFLEHLEWPERVFFFNELYRVMKPGSVAHIATPHWSHSCYYGDPGHKAPLSEWYCFYLNKEWRDLNAGPTGYTCDFDWGFGGSWDGWLETRNTEFRTFAMNRHVNSWRDLIVTLTKRKA